MNSSEIAKLAGVSRSTVSRVLNGYSNVPPATKKKVEDALNKYGYIPNNAARNLRGKPSRIIGMFFVGIGDTVPDSIHSSPFFAEFLVFFADALKNHKYQLLISVINDLSQIENLKSLFADKTISGAVLMGDIVSEDCLLSMSKLGNKCILINQRAECDLENISLLNTENYQAAYDAVQLLIEKGHRRIAHIAGYQTKISTADRYTGYCQCLRDNDIALDASLVVFGNIHIEDNGYKAGKELLERNKNNFPTAIFCSNDLMAIGFMRAMEELGICVPDDISIIGFDNSELSKCSHPKLSTVETNTNKIAIVAADTLIRSIEVKEENPNLKKQILSEYTIIDRESVRRIE